MRARERHRRVGNDNCTRPFDGCGCTPKRHRHIDELALPGVEDEPQELHTRRRRGRAPLRLAGSTPLRRTGALRSLHVAAARRRAGHAGCGSSVLPSPTVRGLGGLRGHLLRGCSPAGRSGNLGGSGGRGRHSGHRRHRGGGGRGRCRGTLRRGAVSVRRSLGRREECVERVGFACCGCRRCGRHGGCGRQRGDRRHCGRAVILPVGVVRALTGCRVVRRRRGHGCQRRSGGTPLIGSLTNTIETAGSPARTLGALNLAGARRERRVLAQVDEAGTGGAAQPRAPVVDHRIRGKQAHAGELEENGEGRVAQGRAERRGLRVVLVADQAHAHEGHARGPTRRAEHERGGNHGLGGDHPDRPRREVHVPRHADQGPEDQ